MKYYIANCFAEFWQVNKLSIIILLCVSVAGLIMGIVLTANSEMETSSANYIILIREANYKIFANYLKALFLYLIVFVLVFCSVFHKYARCIPYIVIAIVGYRLGCKCVLLVIVDKLTGVLCLLTNTLWLYLIIIINIIILTGLIRHLTNGCSQICIAKNKSLMKTFGCIFVVNAVILILFCICIPFIVKLIVVV